MKEYFKWLFAKKELQELERWRTSWEEHNRWLSEFKIVGEVLGRMKEDAKDIPMKYPFINSFRQHLRSTYKE